MFLYNSHRQVQIGIITVSLSVAISNWLYVLTSASVIFFLIYLLSHNISRKIRQFLILLCEAHFALLYLLQIELISNALEQKGSLSLEIILQLGMHNALVLGYLN